MVGEDHAGALGNVLHAAHFIADTDDHLGQPHGAVAPGLDDEAVALAERQQRCDHQADQAPEERAGRQQQVEKRDSECLH